MYDAAARELDPRVVVDGEVPERVRLRGARAARTSAASAATDAMGGREPAAPPGTSMAMGGPRELLPLRGRSSRIRVNPVATVLWRGKERERVRGTPCRSRLTPSEAVR